MTDTITEFGGAVVLCTDCKEPLSDKAKEHSKEGFGHGGRCCACYDARMKCGPKHARMK